MATGTLQAFSFAGDQCTAAVLYDTVTLVVTGIDYRNLTAFNATVEVDRPTGGPRLWTLAANTPQTTQPAGGQPITLVQRSTTDKYGNPVTVVEWPTGWSLQARWPA